MMSEEKDENKIKEEEKQEATQEESQEESKAESETNDNNEIDDVVFETSENEEEGLDKTLNKTIGNLRSNLKSCEKEKIEYLAGWQKERADFANYKKQEEIKKSEYFELIKENILGEFITVLDSFNLAFSNKEAWEKVDKNWRLGVEGIYNQFSSILKEFGVEEIGSVGDTFDTNFHQSIKTTPTEIKEDDNKIAEVTQRGYKIGRNVLRPAKVNIFEYSLK